MATNTSLSLQEYLAMFRRHALLIAAIVLSISLLGSIVAAILPSGYESSAVILIVPQDISQELVPSAFNDYADQEIDMVRQRVMTRDNLLDIIRKYHLYGANSTSPGTQEQVDAFLRNVSIDLIDTKTRTQTNRNVSPTIAFRVSFQGGNPAIVNKVDNDLVTLFLNENAKTGIARATDATNFLNQAASGLQDQLNRASQQITQFKMQNSASLPENKDVTMAAYQATVAALRDLGRDAQATQDQISNLEFEQQAAQSGIGPTNDQTDAADPAVQLERLKNEYTRLSAIYNDNHPTMVSLRNKIKNLQDSLASNPKAGSSATAAPGSDGDLLSLQISAKIKAAKSQLALLAQQRQAAEAHLNQLQHQLLLEPEVAQQLSGLQINFDDLKKKYDEIRLKQNSAQLNASLQEENKAEHFELIEPPVVPDKPVRPNRIKIVAMGVLASLMAAAGAVFLLENIGKKVRGVNNLIAATNVQPLVIIPEIRSENEARQQARRLRNGMAMVLAGFLLLLLLVHVFIMPLDQLAHRVMHYSTVPIKGSYGKS